MEPSNAEKFAFWVVGRVLGDVIVEHYDIPPRQGAVDAVLHRPGVPDAALEVTILTDEAAAQVEAILANDHNVWRVPDAQWWWSATFDARANLAEARKVLPGLIRWCEAHGVTQPGWDTLRGSGVTDQWRRWLDSAGVTLNGHPETPAHAGEIFVLPGSQGGGVLELSDVPSWLSGELTAERTARKVRKLERSGHAERHLFLIVDWTGVPFPLVHALSFGDGLPTDSPNTGSLTHIWLTARFGQFVLLFDAENGWRRYEPFDGQP